MGSWAGKLITFHGHCATFLISQFWAIEFHSLITNSEISKGNSDKPDSYSNTKNAEFQHTISYQKPRWVWASMGLLWNDRSWCLMGFLELQISTYSCIPSRFILFRQPPFSVYIPKSGIHFPKARTLARSGNSLHVLMLCCHLSKKKKYAAEFGLAHI